MQPSWRVPKSPLERLTPMQFRATVAAACVGVLVWDFFTLLPTGFLYLVIVGATFWSADRWMPMATGVAGAVCIMIGLASPVGPTSYQLALLMRVGGALIFIGFAWLTTRHRVLLAEAREREGVLRTIFDSEPACVKVLGPGCVLLDMNRAGLDMIEAGDLQSLRGAPLLPLVVEQHRDAFARMCERVFAGESVSLQFEVVGLKGKRRWMHSQNAPLRNAAGHVTALLAVTQDVTDQKRAEWLLRDSEHRLTQAADIAGLGFFEHDHRTGAIYWSTGARAILGMGPTEERSSEEVFAAIHADDRAMTMTMIARAHDPNGNGSMSMEHRIVRPSGEVRHLSIRSQTTFGPVDGEPALVRTMGTLLDVTDQKQAEAQIRQNEQRLAMATEMAGLGFFERDYRDGTHYWSEDARTIFGMSPSDTWTSEDLVRATHPDDRALLLAGVKQLHDPGHGELTVEHRVVRPNGDVRHVMVRGQMQFEHDGLEPRPRRAVATLWDITERKQAEAQRDALALRVLEAQENERRAVARDLHDEIGQALSALKLNLLRLRREATGAGPIVTDSLRIADEVLQQVRDIALSLRPSILDDLGLGAAVQWYAEQTAGRASLTLSCEVEGNVAGISPATEIACFRVLQEALTNVVRHAAATSVLVQLRDTGNHVELVVRDDGRGFDVDRVIANAGRGSSMGLVGIRERAALLGGVTTVTSAPGVGCEIRVHLPILAHHHASAEVIA